MNHTHHYHNIQFQLLIYFNLEILLKLNFYLSFILFSLLPLNLAKLLSTQILYTMKHLYINHNIFQLIFLIFDYIHILKLTYHLYLSNYHLENIHTIYILLDLILEQP